MADNYAHPGNRCQVLTIDDLPDDVLVEIFDFYVVRYRDLSSLGVHDFYTIREDLESWQSLVHVCRRWRGLVFASPRHLNLQICCYTPEGPARKSLDVWPALPLFIIGRFSEELVDNVIPGNEHRISQIKLGGGTIPQFGKLWTAMQVPFPELIALYLSSYGPVLPDSFLGGSAPRLRYFFLNGVPFPGLPKLLLSTTHLVKLSLHNISHLGYISPDAMATCLSMLTSLESLHLHFEHSQYYPGLKSQYPFFPTRSVLPALAVFSFEGVNEYLEELVTQIDAPQLYQLSTTFSYDIDFKIPELNQFISRTPTLGAYDEAHLVFDGYRTIVRLRQSQSKPSGQRMVEAEIVSLEGGQQLSSLQICTSSLRLLSTMENLYIDGNLKSPLTGIWQNIWNTQWLDLLLPFTAVKNLYLSELFSPHISRALQELSGERITELFPALQNILMEGFHPSNTVQKGIAQFITARQLTAHPVAISAWRRHFYRS